MTNATNISYEGQESHEGTTPVVVMTDRGTVRIGYHGREFIEVANYPHTIFSALLEREVDRPGLILKEPLYLNGVPESTKKGVTSLIAGFRQDLHPSLDDVASEDD